MKLFALLSAGLLAGATLAAPADAQYRHRHDRHGYGNGRGRVVVGGYGYRGYGYRGYGHRGYRRGRIVCTIHRGYYGPVRRCRRIL